jgi:hypothetical protein
MKVSRWVVVLTWVFAIMMGLGSFLNWVDDLTGNWSALIAVSVLWIIGLVKKNPALIMSMMTIAIADEVGALIRGSELGSSGSSLVFGVLMGIVLSFWIRAYTWSFLAAGEKP